MRAQGRKHTEAEAVKLNVSRNLRALPDTMQWSEHDLARRSHVSQKAINNILNGSTGCTVSTAEKLAIAFGLHGWQLMLENAPTDAALSSTLTGIVDFMLNAGQRRQARTLQTLKYSTPPRPFVGLCLT
jgi:transcriptional regulator with XRE-family HTH domain